MDLQIKRRISVILFLVGALSGTIFNLFVVWVQLEAMLWNATPTDDAALDGLSCPMMITANELGEVRVEYDNPLERTINPVVRTYITQELISLQQEDSVRPDIQPGDTARLEYTVSSQNAVWDRFILVRVYTLPQYTLPSRSGSCGILFVNLPLLDGWMVEALVLLVSVGGMVGGAWMWSKINAPLNPRAATARRAMVYLAGVVILGLVLGLLGILELAGAVLLLTFLMMAAQIGVFLAAP